MTETAAEAIIETAKNNRCDFIRYVVPWPPRPGARSAR